MPVIHASHPCQSSMPVMTPPPSMIVQIVHYVNHNQDLELDKRLEFSYQQESVAVTQLLSSFLRIKPLPWDRLRLQINHSKEIHCIARRKFNICYQILVLHHEKFCQWYLKLKLVQGCHREHQLSQDEPSQGKLWRIQCVLEAGFHCPSLVNQWNTIKPM